MSRRIGRSRRNGGGTFPPPEAFYGLGITIDFDADATYVTKDGSNRVSAWANRGTTGATNTLAQGTGANQPLWTAGSTPNGKPSIRTDSTARNLLDASATALGATGNTFFIVRKFNGNGQGWLRINGAATQGYRLNASGGNYQVVCGGSTNLTFGAVDTSKFYVEAYRLAASGGTGTAIDTKEQYLNGVLQAAPAGTPNYNAGANQIVMGLSGSSADQEIARVMEAQSLLSANDTIAVSRALMRAYGIT